MEFQCIFSEISFFFSGIRGLEDYFTLKNYWKGIFSVTLNFSVPLILILSYRLKELTNFYAYIAMIAEELQRKGSATRWQILMEFALNWSISTGQVALIENPIYRHVTCFPLIMSHVVNQIYSSRRDKGKHITIHLCSWSYIL